MAFDIVIMAAGKGTRMRSALPKVLHRLAGRSLLQHVLRAAAGLGADRVVVVTGHGAEAVEAACESPGTELRFARQMPQLGTGHAVRQALPALHDTGTTLILNGDVPLLETATARALVEASGGERLALLTFEPADPTGYGRIVRGRDGTIHGIVEHRDATPAQRAIREVYTGVMAAPTAALRRWLAALGNDNAQGEYYLTDVVAMAVAEGVPVVATMAADEAEVLGVNSPAQLADLERRHQLRVAARLMDEHGVRLADPARFDLRGTLACGRDVEIDVNGVFGGEATLGDDVRIGPNCVLDGRVVLSDGVRVGANCMLRNVEVGAGAVIHPYTHVDGEALGVTVGAGARVGPYARLRPGARLGEEVHVGNFVEVKNSTLGRGAKANHLAYLGDATVGERVNFGAGSITANYDGVNKHRTTIGDDASIGSNCVLIAPVVVGAGATLGGGSTLAKDAPAGQLTVARARAATYPNWTRPKKKVAPPAD